MLSIDHNLIRCGRAGYIVTPVFNQGAGCIRKVTGIFSWGRKRFECRIQSVKKSDIGKYNDYG